jgi:carbonic anhydrase/acetyltransferase-like protein (isoleucine patch superfamily)
VCGVAARVCVCVRGPAPPARPRAFVRAGDLSPVDIGTMVSVGDRAVLHTSKSVEGKPAARLSVGDHVTIGAGALLQSCTVEAHARVGAGAVVLEGALVEEGAEVADGAVVHAGRRIPHGQLWAGNPAVFVRELSKTELAARDESAAAAADLAAAHAHEFLPFSAAYQQAEALGVADPALAALEAEQAARDAGAGSRKALSPEERDVEDAVAPARALSPPPGQTWAGRA